MLHGPSGDGVLRQLLVNDDAVQATGPRMRNDAQRFPLRFGDTKALVVVLAALHSRSRPWC